MVRRGSGPDNIDDPQMPIAIPPLRVAVGLGDPERERALLPALREAGDLAVVARCLAADQLLAETRAGAVEVALVAFDLHRLTSSLLADLARTSVPLVILAPDPDAPRWQAVSGIVLSTEAEPVQVHGALFAALRGGHPPWTDEQARDPEPTSAAGSEDATVDAACPVVAVASGPGSPGRTTVALNLAASLGAVSRTVLVDADLCGPSVAAFLDADPTRNIAMLAHAEPDTSEAWTHAISQELQPLSPASPHSRVLCGIPKPDLRTRISAPFLERLVGELRQRYDYVILDVGADLLGRDLAVHRIAVALSTSVLVVAASDLVGLWRACTALDLLQTHLSMDPDRLALVLNRHDRRHHHRRAEIEWAFGLPAAALIPEDYGSAQRALAAQRPLVLDARSRAGWAIRDLAERISAGRITPSPEPACAESATWLRRLTHQKLARWRRSNPRVVPQEGASDGEPGIAVRTG